MPIDFFEMKDEWSYVPSNALPSHTECKEGFTCERWQMQSVITMVAVDGVCVCVCVWVWGWVGEWGQGRLCVCVCVCVCVCGVREVANAECGDVLYV